MRGLQKRGKLNPGEVVTGSNDVRPREPWMAVFLSSLLPGLGQIHAGAVRRGSLWIGLFIAIACAMGWRFFTLAYSPDIPVTPRNLLILRLLLLAPLPLYTLCLVDGFIYARRSNRSRGVRPPWRGARSPWLPCVLSRFIPGLGQICNGRIMRAAAFAAAWLCIVVLARGSWLRLLGAAIVLWSMSDAFHNAMILSGRADRLFGRFSPLSSALICLALLLVYLPYPMLARDYLFETFVIRGGAMQPVLLPRDRVIIDKLTIRMAGFRRGDVAAFNCPDRPGDYYVKRVVGLPGESIEIRRGKVFIDGEPLKTGGVIDTIPYLNYGPYGREGQVVRIPGDRYYFLGDRLRESYDSRLYGPIPREEIVGRVVKIYHPPGRKGPVEYVPRSDSLTSSKGRVNRAP